MKARRQQAILDLVSRERLSSQEDIRARLMDAGLSATQSTISRDIEELGLARIHDQEGLRYVLPGDVPVTNGHAPANGQVKTLRHLLREYALSLTPSANILVVSTPPGAANILAEGIDKAGLEEVAGTLAGDNAILVVAREGIRAATLERELRKVMGEDGR